MEIAYQNGTCLTHLNDARTASAYQPGMPAGELRGFDGAGRMVAHRWLQCTLDAGFPTGYVNPGTPLIGFRHAWNGADNKLSQELMHGTDKSEAYKYDSAYRLIRFDRGTLNAALTDIVTPTPLPNILQAQTFSLDGPGNWPSNTTTTNGVPTTENRTHNNLNQITSVATGGPPVSLLYDSNGNLTDDGTNTFAWDAKNRLRRATRKSDNVLVGTYSYDPLGRRIRRIYIVSADPAKTVHYYLDGQRVIEEREVEGTPPAEVFKRQYTYGPYIDECLTLDRDLNANGVATDPGERLFYHANTLYSICALSDSNRSQPERYLYDAYGRHILWVPGPDGIFGTADDVYTVQGLSTVQNSLAFTCRELESETCAIHFRNRRLHIRVGRFASRDLRSGPLVNLYLYVGSVPTVYVDPLGLVNFSPIWSSGKGKPKPGPSPGPPLPGDPDPGDVPPDIEDDRKDECVFECKGSPCPTTKPGRFCFVDDPNDLLKKCKSLAQGACSRVTVGGHGSSGCGVCTVQKGIYSDCFGCNWDGSKSEQFAEIAACLGNILGKGGYLRICSCSHVEKTSPGAGIAFENCLRDIAQAASAKVCACYGAATGSTAPPKYCVCKGYWVCREPAIV